MEDSRKTKASLLSELAALRRRVAELEAAEARHAQAGLGAPDDLAERQGTEARILRLSELRQQLLGTGALKEKLQLITDAVVEIFGAELSRIWIAREGDLCQTGCRYGAVAEGPDACRDRARCLQLVASSGLYTSLEGSHRRVPMGAHNIGRVASGEEPHHLTNDIAHDRRIHDREWATGLGLVSFAGYRLLSGEARPVGVLALFSKRAIASDEARLLEDLANATSQVIVTGMVQEELRKSEERYRQSVENSPNPIFSVDSQGSIRTWNRACERVFGCGGTMIGRHYRAVLWNPDDDGPAVDAMLRRVFQGGSVSGVDVRYASRAGECRLMVCRLYPVGGPQGRIEACVFANADVTERRRAEDALRESQQMLRSVLDAIPVRVFWKDRDLRYLGCNRPFALDAGLKASEDIVGRNDFEMGWAEQAEMYRADDRMVIDTGTPKVDYEEPQTTPSGGRIWLRTSKIPLLDAEGRIKGVLGTYEDITAWKGAGDALRESEEKYRLVIENASEAIFIVQDAAIKFPNPRAVQMLGFSAEELALMPFSELIHPDHKGAVLARYQTGQWGGDLHTGDSFRVVTKGGEELWVQLNAAQVHWEGRPAILNFVRDVTPQKKLEHQLLQAQKMEAVGRLAGGIAHDFNNILTVVMGCAQLLLVELPEDHPVYSDAEQIHSAAQRAASLIHQLLAFSRKQISQPRVLNMSEVLGKMQKMLTRVIGEDIELVTHFDPDLWPVAIDPGQLDQVIMNLAVNARDAMPQGGKLTIQTANAHLDGRHLHLHEVEGVPGQYVMVVVTDTGVGMDRATQSHIFEPFFTTKEKGKGTGLGLPTVYGIVRQNGGFIWVYSETGQGTTFKFFLPRFSGDGAGAGEERQPEMEYLGGSETILLVEDDEMLRTLAVNVLRQYGYEVLEARAGDEAMSLFERYQGAIALALSDVVMPGLSGPELAAQLQARRPETKVLLMSGYADDVIHRYGFLAVDLPLIEKPFSVEGLLSKVRQVLDS